MMKLGNVGDSKVIRELLAKVSVARAVQQLIETCRAKKVSHIEEPSVLTAHTHHFANIVESSGDAIITKNLDGIISGWNKSAESMFGYKESEVLGWPITVLFPEDRMKEEEDFLQIIRRGEKVEHIRTVRVHKDGSKINVSITILPIYNSLCVVVGASKIVRNINAEVKAEKLIWDQAHYDSLTGLPNRQLMSDRLTQEIEKAQCTQSSIALMLIDLDHFKQINSSLGQVVGDEFLRLVGQRLKSLMRHTDTVSRLDGDEFAIMLPDMVALMDVEKIAAKLIVDLQQPFLINDSELFISISLGVAVYPEDGKSVDELLKHADLAMYAAKNGGRNQHKLFNTEMATLIENSWLLLADLRKAQALNQLELYFQPIVSLATGVVKKAESLIRWHHPQRGLVSPDQFIPLAEAYGLIQPIGEWVFDSAIVQLKKWQAYYGNDFQLSINKSPLQFQAQDGAEILWVDKMRAMGVAGNALVIEITECSLMDYSDNSMQKVASFKQSGIEIALDDFGTGYSSLSYLNEFDLDYLKIDRSFVRNLTALSKEYSLCESIVVMAHNLGIKVIVEGVETEQQRLLLTQMGCDYAQGYLFSKPVCAADFEQYMAQNLSAVAGSDQLLALTAQQRCVSIVDGVCASPCLNANMRRPAA
jgi:diguanylate cyclase (GGDEF)-like protein/PAS domain S-box-containing protein